jgi:hypothetical protein
MIEPLVRWLNASQKGYDGTLVTNTIEDMVTLLDIVEQFSDWSGISLNVGKYKILAYVQDLQTFRQKIG